MRTPRITYFLVAVALVLTGGRVVAQDRVEITGSRIKEDPPPVKTVVKAGQFSSAHRGWRYFGLRESNGHGVMEVPGVRDASEDSKSRSPAVASSQPQVCSGNPVDLATGNKLQTDEDFVSNGSYGASLIRHYRSQWPASLQTSMFGPGWHSNLEYGGMSPSGSCWTDPDTGFCFPHHVDVQFPDGAVYRYASVGAGTYSSNGSAALGQLFHMPGPNGWNTSLNINGSVTVFNQAGMVTSVSNRDRSGMTLTYAANYPSRLIRVTDRAGRQTNFTWTGNRVTQVTDPAGQQWTYTYYANGMLESVRSPGSDPDIRRYVYGNASFPQHLTAIQNNGVMEKTVEYDTSGRVKKSVLAGSEEFDDISYTANATTVTDARGQPTVYTFVTVQGSKLLTHVSRQQTTSCLATARQMIYDATGYPHTEFNWRNIRSDHEYDSAGRLLSITRMGASPTEAQSRINTWEGDRLKSVSYAGQHGHIYRQRIYTYHTSTNANGRIASVSERDPATGAMRTTSYDYTFHNAFIVKSLKTTTTLPTGSAVSTEEYDSSGNLIKFTNALGHVTTFSGYDGLGRPAQQTDPNGVVTTFVWNPQGTLKSSTVVLATGNRTTSFSYNRTRQLTQVAHPSGAVEKYAYNAAGRLTGVGNALNQYINIGRDVPSRTWTRTSSRQVPALSGTTPVGVNSGNFVATDQEDSLGRPWKTFGNDGQVLTHAYDGNANLLTSTDALNRVVTRTYDPHDRIKTVTDSAGTTTYEYDVWGRWSRVQDPNGLQTTYEFNGFGDITKVTSPDSGVTVYAYDVAGRLATETRANGKVIAYAWDALNRLVSRSSGAVTETFSYDQGTHGMGRMTGMSDASGSTSWSYSAAGEMVQQTAVIGGSSYVTTWGYDPAGRFATMAYPGGVSLAFARDAYGRLSSVSQGSTVLANNFLYQPATDLVFGWRLGQWPVAPGHARQRRAHPAARQPDEA